MLSNIEIACPNCNEAIVGSRQMIDACPKCMKPWRDDYFKQQQMDTGDTKKIIADFVVNAFMKAKRDALWTIGGVRLDTWHVSDFVSPCLRKTHYSKIPTRSFLRPFSTKFNLRPFSSKNSIMN